MAFGTILRTFAGSTSSSPSALCPRSSSLVALPSMSHSLSALPTMTGLPDMLHYGTLGAGATKNLSEAKLDSALRKPRKDDSNTPTHPYLPNQKHINTPPCYQPSEDDHESQIVFYPKRNHNKKGTTKAK